MVEDGGGRREGEKRRRRGHRETNISSSRVTVPSSPETLCLAEQVPGGRSLALDICDLFILSLSCFLIHILVTLPSWSYGPAIREQLLNCFLPRVTLGPRSSLSQDLVQPRGGNEMQFVRGDRAQTVKMRCGYSAKVQGLFGAVGSSDAGLSCIGDACGNSNGQGVLSGKNSWLGAFTLRATRGQQRPKS